MFKFQTYCVKTSGERESVTAVRPLTLTAVTAKELSVFHLPVFHSQLTEAQCVRVAGARPQLVCVALEATLSGAVRCGGRNRARVQVCLRLLEILL